MYICCEAQHYNMQNIARNKSTLGQSVGHEGYLDREYLLKKEILGLNHWFPR